MSDHAEQLAQRRRFARIRWRFVLALHGGRSNQSGGWMTGKWIMDTLDYCGPDYRVSEQEAMDLLQDLVTTGYALEEDNREDRSQPYSLDHLTYRITAKGIGFVNRTEAPDALIDDGRIVRPRNV